MKEGVLDDRGVRVPNVKVLDDYKCPRRERRIVMDEVWGNRGSDVIILQGWIYFLGQSP